MTRTNGEEQRAGATPHSPTDAQGKFAVLGRQALLAFWRDLPQLLQERSGQWVAYHGDRQLGFAPTRAELWRDCVRRGLQPGEFLVRSVEPEDPDLILEPMAGE